MVLNEKQINNFFKKVFKTDTCWEWTGHRSNGGYGKVNINNFVYYAHKISLNIVGILDEPKKKELGSRGKIVMHSCDNRSCVNPKHLAIASQKDNMADAKKKMRKWNGRFSGQNNPNCKLKLVDVAKIRGGMTIHDFSKLYPNVNRSQFYNIKNVKSWITAY